MITVNATDFRRAALQNGYRLVRVRPRDKRPIAKQWQTGESNAVLLGGDPNENTGLLLDGLRAVDLDIDDPCVAVEVLSVVAQFVPRTALVRYREGSTRLAFICRAAGDLPRASLSVRR